MLATDDSEHARIAEAWITRLRWEHRPIVDVLTIDREPRAVVRLAYGLALQTYRTAVSDAAGIRRQRGVLDGLRVANAAAQRLQRAGLQTRSWTRQGDPVSEIAAMVRSESPDLLVVGCGCRRGWLEQSDVASALVARMGTKTSILVTKTLPDGPDTLPGRILIATNGHASGEFESRLSRTGWLKHANVTVDTSWIRGGDERGVVADVVVVSPLERRPGSPSVQDLLDRIPAVLVLPNER